MRIKRFRLFLLVLIVLAHLGLLQLASRKHFTRPEPFVVIPVALLDAPVATKFKAPPPKVIAQKKVSQRKLIKNPAPIDQIVSDSPAPADSSSSADVQLDTPVEQAEPAEQIAPEPTTVPALTILPPPSARYALDVVRFDPKAENPYYGSGEIQWVNNGKDYTMQINVGIDMILTKIRLYDIESEGTISNEGVKPRMVTEARRGRAATSTHFNYESKSISFSATTAIIPLVDGAQDKATVLMQLAAIGNANALQFQPEQEITIQVAEEKDASPFLFKIIGKENIDTKLGNLTTWHIVRPPRPGTYSSRLDIWLAPDLNWLPAQVRNTEANGAITIQTIRKIITG